MFERRPHHAPGIWTDYTPPAGYPRYRPLLGTSAEIACSYRMPFADPPCGRPATRIWCTGTAPGEPLCEDHYRLNDEHADAACGCLARRNADGVWRPTDQLGDLRAAPYDFDW